MSTSRAKKKKKAMRAKRREKRRRAIVAELRITAPALLSPVAGMRKLSATLLDYAAPLLQHVVDDEELEGALVFASTLWNIANLFDSGKMSATVFAAQQKQLLDEGAPTPEDRITLESMVALLVDRKQTLFREDTRIITEFRINRDGKRVSVTTTGTLEL